MAPHSSTLAWKIPWTEEPGGLQSMGSLRVTRLSDFTFTFHFHALEEEMATHFSILAWRIPGMGEPGGLPSVGSHRVGLKGLSSSSSNDLEGLSWWLRSKDSSCNAGNVGLIPGWGRFLEKEMVTYSRASLIAQLVKNPPPVQETLVRFLCWEDPLEKG